MAKQANVWLIPSRPRIGTFEAPFGNEKNTEKINRSIVMLMMSYRLRRDCSAESGLGLLFRRRSNKPHLITAGSEPTGRNDAGLAILESSTPTSATV